jgi:hypothetical protein
VREKFRRVKPLKEISVTQRGWTLDVLSMVRRLVESRRRGDESGSGAGKRPSLLTSAPTGDLSRLGNGERNLAESKGPRGPSARARASQFTTADAYAFTRELENLHPDNRHVRDNPVNNRVTRGRNPPAIAGIARRRVIDPSRSWRMAIALNGFGGRAALLRRHARQSGSSALPLQRRACGLMEFGQRSHNQRSIGTIMVVHNTPSGSNN